MDFSRLSELTRSHNPNRKAVEVNQPSINSLNGRDVATLNSEESAIFETLKTHGRKFGVSITVVSEAPKEELERAVSRQEYDEIIARWPSRITITTS
ncbi:hypothetical protein VITU102760_24970 [Vibrio tubiashii]|uniref:Uncharacterized protein n=1 Tax=Vibrio tubiashii ATCC 19109 TaxID=1051646 RepID=F9T6P7_9VIBR|nr:hypothetical protein [Vibrio tubiashii]AIW17523.1 hypothetical protein IX91_26050 [Vibrio tubiashii ATCC 19109]EGU54452.1 hypothetical protein VITU9109_02722 [Vibrio tubiashii ATCC 19109]EIF05902.1 hypothetical protein VT1337_01095 [Vibrio tubiashii NCIMB 1337 = ATCC 19106]